MKLHHFITANVSEDGNRARQIGKALAPEAAPVTTQPVNEVKLAEIKRVTPNKPPSIKRADQDDDLTQEIRDYAVAQMEKSEHSSLLHRKIRHYD